VNDKRKTPIGVRQLKKICIIGLLSKQANRLMVEFSRLFHDVRFVFFPAEEVNQTLSGKYDLVILMTKFISHRNQNNARNHKIVLFHHGPSLLREFIKTI
jgi:hypothetical protein